MNNLYKITDFNEDGFLHTRIYDVIYKLEQKLFSINVGFADLKTGGALVDCTITITDWWDFEVTEKGTGVNVTYKPEEIPLDIEQIFRYEYDGTTIVFIAMGYLSIDAVVYYKFTKPKIHITGQYDPD